MQQWLTTPVLLASTSLCAERSRLSSSDSAAKVVPSLEEPNFWTMRTKSESSLWISLRDRHSIQSHSFGIYTSRVAPVLDISRPHVQASSFQSVVASLLLAEAMAEREGEATVELGGVGLR